MKRKTKKQLKPRQLSIAVCPLKQIRKFIEDNHYSHSVNGVKVSYCFKVTFGTDIVGAVLYGQLSTTAWKKFGDTEAEVLELRRLVLDDIAGHNSESYVIGHTLRWLKRNAPVVRTIISYADPLYGHSGVIYRATNFEYLGLTPDDKGYKHPETGKIYHSRALRTKYKGEYKPFVKKLRKLFEEGKLETVILPGKHRYRYKLR